MDKTFKIRDLRKKDQYKIDDAYLNGYARLCGVYATAVYNSLSRHANFHTQECFPSMDKIAEQHSISKPSVIKGIAELVKWNIVAVHKEKDPDTKRQMPNVYVLVDKSDWKPKPESRVKEIDSETPEPSKRQEKSRVNHVDCKEYKGEKDDKLGEVKNFAGYDIVKEKETETPRYEKKDTSYLAVFQLWGAKYPLNWRVNRAEIQAAKNILAERGLKNASDALAFARKHSKDEYCPQIDSPCDLDRKWNKLSKYEPR